MLSQPKGGGNMLQISLNQEEVVERCVDCRYYKDGQCKTYGVTVVGSEKNPHCRMGKKPIEEDVVQQEISIGDSPKPTRRVFTYAPSRRQENRVALCSICGKSANCFLIIKRVCGSESCGHKGKCPFTSKRMKIDKVAEVFCCSN